MVTMIWVWGVVGRGWLKVTEVVASLDKIRMLSKSDKYGKQSVRYNGVDALTVKC